MSSVTSGHGCVLYCERHKPQRADERHGSRDGVYFLTESPCSQTLLDKIPVVDCEHEHRTASAQLVSCWSTDQLTREVCKRACQLHSRVRQQKRHVQGRPASIFSRSVMPVAFASATSWLGAPVCSCCLRISEPNSPPGPDIFADDRNADEGKRQKPSARRRSAAKQRGSREVWPSAGESGDIGRRVTCALQPSGSKQRVCVCL